MRLHLPLLALCATILAPASFAQALPTGVKKLTTVEGITEYSYSNGLRALLFHDPSNPKVTVMAGGDA